MCVAILATIQCSNQLNNGVQATCYLCCRQSAAFLLPAVLRSLSLFRPIFDSATLSVLFADENAISDDYVIEQLVPSKNSEILEFLLSDYLYNEPHNRALNMHEDNLRVWLPSEYKQIAQSQFTYLYKID